LDEPEATLLADIGINIPSATKENQLGKKAFALKVNQIKSWIG
jgi:hypothetical protein